MKLHASAAAAAAVLALCPLPYAAAQECEVREPTPAARLEFGLDERFLWPDTASTFIQQFTGVSIAVDVPVFTREAGGGTVGLRAAAETGLSWNTTGLARWMTRAHEIEVLNGIKELPDPIPALRPEIVFGLPVFVPLLARTEVSYRPGPRFSVQCGAEFALSFLFYGEGDVSVRFCAAPTLGCRFHVSERVDIGLRLKYVVFGDRDIWTGFGAGLYCGVSP